MTTDEWLRIAQVVSTLIAPLIAGYIISRINRPPLSPETNQPKTKIRQIGRWLIRYRWPTAIFVMAFSLGIHNFVRALRDPNMLPREFVLSVAFSIGGITFLLTTLLFIYLFSLAFSFMHRSMVEVREFNEESHEQILDWLQRVTEALKEGSTSAKGASTFERILDNLKKLVP